MDQISEEKRFLLIEKLKCQIDRYLPTKYSNTKKYRFSPNTKDEFISELDKYLVDVDNIIDANFILPNGKLKKIEFDFSDFKVNELYTQLMFINNANLNEFVKNYHYNVQYFGFSLEDVLLSGVLKVTYGEADVYAVVLEYDSTYYKPTKAILDQIEILCSRLEIVYITNIKNSKMVEKKISDPYLFTAIKKTILQDNYEV